MTQKQRRNIGWTTVHFLANSDTGYAMVNALMVPCPECKRTSGNACVLPDGLAHQGIFLHHQRIAAGDKK